MIPYLHCIPGDEITIRRRGRFTARAIVTGWRRPGWTLMARVQGKVGGSFSDTPVPIPAEAFICVSRAACRDAFNAS